MKTVTADFLAARALFQPPAAIKNIVLSEHELDGTLLNEYDLSSRLKGGLPIIDKEIEKELNEFITGEMTLKFHDPDKYIENILTQSNRMFGLKAKETFDVINPIISDSVSIGNYFEQCKFSPDGRYLFALSFNGDFKKYSINRETGEVTFVKGVTPGGGHYCFEITEDYLYLLIADGSLIIYNYDLIEIGSNSPGTSGTVQGVHISPDENHLWFSAHNVAGQTGLYNISDKTNPTFVGYIQIGYRNYCNLYLDEKLFVLDDISKYLRIYDASNIETIPYSLLSSLEIGFAVDNFIYDETRAILYIIGTGGTVVVDMSDTSNLIITAQKTEAGYETSLLGRGCKIGNKLFINNATDNKIYIIDTGNHYQLKNFDSFDFPVAKDYAFDVAWNKSNIVAWIGRTGFLSSTLYTAKARQDWLPLFDGKVQSTHRKGRNTRIVSAQTWEKEFEQHNAELVFDTENMACRNITGVGIVSITGGKYGLKTLSYKYEQDDAGDLFEFQYENGTSVIVEGTQYINLYNETKEQILRIYFDAAEALKEDAEDTFIISQDLSDIGQPYQAIDVATLIGKLFDTSTIEILNRTIDVNDVTLPLPTSQFLYFHKTHFGITSGEDAFASTDKRTVSDDKIFVFHKSVFSYTWNKNDLSFSKTLKFHTYTYLPDTKFVEKILTDTTGNRYLICVGWVEGIALNTWSSREYVCCCGVIKVDSDGNYITHWDDADLAGGNYSWVSMGHSVLLAKSFHWSQPNVLCFGFLKETTPVIGRCDGIYGVAFNTFTGTYIDKGFVDRANTSEQGQGVVVLAGTGSVSGIWFVNFQSADSEVLLYHKHFGGLLYAFNINGMDYASDDILGQFRYNQGLIEGGNSNWCLYSKPKTASETKRQFQLTFQSDDPLTMPSETWSEIALENVQNDDYIYHPSYAYGWRLDDNNNKESIVKLSIPVKGELPVIKNLYSGFLGSEYKINSRPIYDSPYGWIGVATAGYSNTIIVWTVTNVGRNIIQIADFTDFNVREAINKIAEVAISYWKRPERDTAKFISRGNIVGTFTLENSEYKKDYVIRNSKAYIGVEVKNDLHPEYTYRYPDTFNDEEGEVLKIENRFIFPINGYVVAKTLGDWFMQVRKEITLEGFLLTELEELDKIELKLYNVDGSPDIQIDSILVKASFDDNTKKVILTMIEIEGYPFKAIRFRPDYFAG